MTTIYKFALVSGALGIAATALRGAFSERQALGIVASLGAIGLINQFAPALGDMFALILITVLWLGNIVGIFQLFA